LAARRLLLLVPLVLGLAGCSTKIDDAAGEKLIRKAVSQQVKAKVRTVTCPKGLTAKKGATFSCQVTGTDGTTGTALVTEKDDKGNVSVNAPFLHVREVEQSIGSGIKAQVGSDVAVKCPQIVVVKAGGTFDCTAISGSDRAKVKVVQQDAQGRVRYTLQR
jgi:hypothetical protein